MSYPQKKPWNNKGGGKGNFPQTPYVETLLDDRKLRLSAPPVSGRGRRPQCFVTVVGGNPRINVYTEVENDKNNGRIVAKKDALAFYQLLETLDHVIRTPEQQRWTMENKIPDEPQGGGEEGGFQKKGPPIVDTKTIVGRDADGVIYLSVISADKERPKIIFQFGNQYFHTLALRDAPDEKLANRTVSEIAARAWLRFMRATVANILVDMAAKKAGEKAARKAAEGGGGGFQKKPASGDFDDKPITGTTSDAYDDFEDDLPM